MRLTTIASAAILAVSTAAIAQVASTPVEQKGEAANETAPLGNVTANLVAEPAGNAQAATPVAGDPTTSTDSPRK
jgi:hypothetical protein